MRNSGTITTMILLFLSLNSLASSRGVTSANVSQDLSERGYFASSEMVRLHSPKIRAELTRVFERIEEESSNVGTGIHQQGLDERCSVTILKEGSTLSISKVTDNFGFDEELIREFSEDVAGPLPDGEYTIMYSFISELAHARRELPQASLHVQRLAWHQDKFDQPDDCRAANFDYLYFLNFRSQNLSKFNLKLGWAPEEAMFYDGDAGLRLKDEKDPLSLESRLVENVENYEAISGSGYFVNQNYRDSKGRLIVHAKGLYRALGKDSGRRKVIARICDVKRVFASDSFHKTRAKRFLQEDGFYLFSKFLGKDNTSLLAKLNSVFERLEPEDGTCKKKELSFLSLVDRIESHDQEGDASTLVITHNEHFPLTPKPEGISGKELHELLLPVVDLLPPKQRYFVKTDFITTDRTETGPYQQLKSKLMDLFDFDYFMMFAVDEGDAEDPYLAVSLVDTSFLDMSQETPTVIPGTLLEGKKVSANANSGFIINQRDSFSGKKAVFYRSPISCSKANSRIIFLGIKEVAPPTQSK